INTSTTVAASSSSSPPTSSASASARAVMAAEEASPDSKCPICLDRFNNLAYLDRCLHRFCFPCIQEWSHNKAECPLCKQPFASILHSVRAEDDFKEYTLRPAPANSSCRSHCGDGGSDGIGGEERPPDEVDVKEA
uniref:E3 ubiquitin-protein ligase Topors n=1 Tax=Lates calcarifer TaxID=8187 RepID=A0A4W6EYK7_LATCA